MAKARTNYCYRWHFCQKNIANVNDPLFTYIWSEHVSSDSSSKFQQEDEGEEDGEGDGHAVVLLDGAAAAEEGDEEDDAANHNQKNRDVEKLN